MAQNKVIMAFRSRLRSKGYSNIKIKRYYTPEGSCGYDMYGNDLWYVTLTEPLLGFEACFVVSEPQMKNWPGIEFDNCGYFMKQMRIEEAGEGIFV